MLSLQQRDAVTVWRYKHLYRSNRCNQQQWWSQDWSCQLGQRLDPAISCPQALGLLCRNQRMHQRWKQLCCSRGLYQAFSFRQLHRRNLEQLSLVSSLHHASTMCCRRFSRRAYRRRFSSCLPFARKLRQLLWKQRRRVPERIWRACSCFSSLSIKLKSVTSSEPPPQ